MASKQGVLRNYADRSSVENVLGVDEHHALYPVGSWLSVP